VRNKRQEARDKNKEKEERGKRKEERGKNIATFEDFFERHSTFKVLNDNKSVQAKGAKK
jgi:hypothetical protein